MRLIPCVHQGNKLIVHLQLNIEKDNWTFMNSRAARTRCAMTTFIVRARNIVRKEDTVVVSGL